jgi:hypothetical protein
MPKGAYEGPIQCDGFGAGPAVEGIVAGGQRWFLFDDAGLTLVVDETNGFACRAGPSRVTLHCVNAIVAFRCNAWDGGVGDVEGGGDADAGIDASSD